MMYVLVLTIFNYAGFGVTTAEFNSYESCLNAGNIIAENHQPYLTVRFTCVEK